MLKHQEMVSSYDMVGLRLTRTDHTGPYWAEWAGLGRTGLDWTGLERTGPDGLDRTGLDRTGP